MAELVALADCAAETLPCGWATGETHCLMRALTRATAVPRMDTASVCDEVRHRDSGTSCDVGARRVLVSHLLEWLGH